MRGVVVSPVRQSQPGTKFRGFNPDTVLNFFKKIITYSSTVPKYRIRILVAGSSNSMYGRDTLKLFRV